ncbi:MAG: transporter substrate-binding domain-containing protein [Paracoccaceae bacterium]|nr:transporter substrate-binding domain-containing protein [Paracoccaceae bacterium]
MRIAYVKEPPFNDVDPSGDVVGCDIELARFVCARLNEPFDPIETEFSDLLPGLMARRWNMTTGLFATDARRKTVLFSRPVWALSDGFLVRAGNPFDLSGYRALADHPLATLAVIRDQVQHQTALEIGIPEERIKVFATYDEAAGAVGSAAVDAYASVARAHAGFIQQNPNIDAEYLTVPECEKPPEFGCFAVNKQDRDLLANVNRILEGYIGTSVHCEMMAGFGFSTTDIDLVRLEWHDP